MGSLVLHRARRPLYHPVGAMQLISALFFASYFFFWAFGVVLSWSFFWASGVARRPCPMWMAFWCTPGFHRLSKTSCFMGFPETRPMSGHVSKLETLKRDFSGRPRTSASAQAASKAARTASER